MLSIIETAALTPVMVTATGQLKNCSGGNKQTNKIYFITKHCKWKKKVYCNIFPENIVDRLEHEFMENVYVTPKILKKKNQTNKKSYTTGV
jgi:hypothetical protein